MHLSTKNSYGFDLPLTCFAALSYTQHFFFFFWLNIHKWFHYPNLSFGSQQLFVTRPTLPCFRMQMVDSSLDPVEWILLNYKPPQHLLPISIQTRSVFFSQSDRLECMTWVEIPALAALFFVCCLSVTSPGPSMLKRFGVNARSTSPLDISFFISLNIPTSKILIAKAGKKKQLFSFV